MRTLVLYESMFGNTQQVAEAVAVGLRSRAGAVSVTGVGTNLLSDLADVDLLVVAAPTHALAMSSPASRAEAVARGADPVLAVTGVREWLAAVAAHSPAGPQVAAVFDTRVFRARRLPGSAARQMARRLTRSGYSVLDRATFYVRDVTGPVMDGELERAEDWGRMIADLAASSSEAGQGGARG